jgi:hypothetical protein
MYPYEGNMLGSVTGVPIALYRAPRADRRTPGVLSRFLYH